MNRAEIYGGLTVNLNDGPIRTQYSRDLDGKPMARLVIGEAWESIGISVTQSTPETVAELEAAVAELKAWVQRQEMLRALPEVVIQTTDLDGTPVDLDRVQLALDGTRWLWTFEHGDGGEPLMLRLDALGSAVLPLSVVYRQHGPLTPVPQPITAAMYRQVLEAA